jgi:hypothetical protein
MAGTLTISTLSDGTNSTSSTNCIQGSAKAWGRFTSNTGSITATQYYNISSITLTATGVYTVAFTNAMTDANYVALASTSTDASNSVQVTSMFNNASSNANVAPTSSGFVFSTRTTGGTGYNEQYVTFAVIR